MKLLRSLDFTLANMSLSTVVSGMADEPSAWPASPVVAEDAEPPASPIGESPESAESPPVTMPVMS